MKKTKDRNEYDFLLKGPEVIEHPGIQDIKLMINGVHCCRMNKERHINIIARILQMWS